MILILASIEDISANNVIDWLVNQFDKKVVRIHNKNQISDLNFKLLKGGEIDLNFTVNNNTISLNDISASWFRHASISLKKPAFPNDNPNFKKLVHRHILKEEQRISEIIGYSLQRKKHIGQYRCPEPNKFIVLDYAIRFGLEIPETYLKSSKCDMLKLLNNESGMIFKAASNPFYETFENRMYFSYTEELTKETLLHKSENVFPTVFQNKIEKQYEIRSFYFDNEFYSVAIFNNNSGESSVDFRKKNSNTPNRIIPYLLPTEIETKLRKLILHLGYNSCSIDLIKSIDNQYIFLEINPNGQFGFISSICNYHLERNIASFLAGNST